MKRNTRTVLSLVPSLTAHHMTYRGFHITRYSEPEGYRYHVSTLTGRPLYTTRTMRNVRSFVAQYNINSHK